jgi:hypothetical protein
MCSEPNNITVSQISLARRFLAHLRSSTAGLAFLGAIAGIVGALSGPAAPIVIPIAGGLVLAKWMYDVYQAS